MIAMAIANRPRLLIADEPTTALDVTIQAQIVDLLIEAKRSTGAALILVTHDLGLVGDLADRVAVMYAGRIVEVGVAATILERPQHPYTVGLLNSLPRLGAGRVAAMPIAGQAPLPGALPAGCAFHPRCTVGRDRERCRTERPSLARARRHDGGMPLPRRAVHACPTGAPTGRRMPGNGVCCCASPTVRVEFPVRGGALRARSAGSAPSTVSIWRSPPVRRLPSSASRAPARRRSPGRSSVWRGPTAGRSSSTGSVTSSAAPTRRAFRRRVQLVFQDPYASLNPRIRLGDTVGEPLRVHRAGVATSVIAGSPSSSRSSVSTAASSPATRTSSPEASASGSESPAPSPSSPSC